MPDLLTPIKVGRLNLKMRAVLAPLTRLRAEPVTRVPTQLMVDYYTQRAAEGVLLITEATYISPETVSYHTAPGIWTQEQVEGWKKVTEGVHSKGGYIFCQIWHVGRCAHETFNEDPVVKGSGYTTCRSSSDVPAIGESHSTYPDNEVMPHTKPVPFTLEEIARVRRDFVKAAENAIAAGFDGVELHGAHGYLMCQFLNSSANLRTDQYSGSTENRIRLLDEILSDLCAAIGNDRVALRLSPHTNVLPTYGGMTTDDLEGTYGGAYAAADKHKIAYLLVTEQRWSPFDDDAKNAQALRLPCAMSQRWNKYFTSGPIIGASGFTPVSADAAVREGVYDAVCFGRYYISNPDLPRRLEQGLPLNRYSRETFYTQGAEGYTDYPTWDEVCEQLGVEAADYASPGAGASETERAAFEDKLDELVVLSEGKLKYPLVTAKALGVLTSGTGASA